MNSAGSSTEKRRDAGARVAVRRFVVERVRWPQKRIHTLSVCRSVVRALPIARLCRVLHGGLVWLERVGEPAGRNLRDEELESLRRQLVYYQRPGSWEP
jgi:hypothetical protein